jgi:hypothetical protein
LPAFGACRTICPPVLRRKGVALRVNSGEPSVDRTPTRLIGRERELGVLREQLR